MRKCLLALLATAVSFAVTAQFTESFSDGNFTADPAWQGNTADWVITPSLQLQSANQVANASFYLSTPSTLATTAQWELSASLSFNTSSTNYTDIYLIASAADLTATTTAGYFVRIGNVGSSRVDLQACKLEYSIVSPK